MDPLRIDGDAHLGAGGRIVVKSADVTFGDQFRSIVELDDPLYRLARKVRRTTFAGKPIAFALVERGAA
jgi:hypothetical protein